VRPGATRRWHRSRTKASRRRRSASGDWGGHRALPYVRANGTCTTTDHPPRLLRQNGYVVRDLDRAIDRVAGHRRRPRGSSSPISHRRGRCTGRQPTEPVVSIAFANSGDLQVELIVQEDDSPSIYRSSLDAGGEGFHHLPGGRRTSMAWARAAAEAGLAGSFHAGNAGGMAQFAYYDQGGVTKHGHRAHGAERRHHWLAATVREAADTWDGSDPVRNLV